MARVKQFADDLGISKNQAQTLINKGRSRKDGGSQILESVMKPKKYGSGGSNKVTKLKKGDNSKATMGNFKNIVNAAVAGKIPPKEAEKAIRKLVLSTPKVSKKDGGATDFGMLSVKAGIDKNPKATQADRIAGAKMKEKPVTRAKGGGMAIQGLGFKGVRQLESQGPNAPSSISADSPSVGIDTPEEEEAYSSIAFGRSPQDTYSAMIGATSKNPFGDNVPGFIKGLSNIFGPLDYTDIFGSQEALDNLARQQFGLAVNPQNKSGMIGYNPNVPTVTTGVREGLTRGFGSLFGSPVGISTFQGPVAAQRSKDPMGSAMLGAFSALAPMSFPALAAQAIGRDTYTTKGAPDYDPTKDPDSPSFTGPSSMGGIVDTLSMLGTGMTSTTAQEVYGATKEAVEEAIDYFSNPKGGSDITSTNTVTSVPTTKPSGTALGKSPPAGIEALDLMEPTKYTEDNLPLIY